MNPRDRQPRLIMALVVAGVVLWGIYLAIGAARGGAGMAPNIWRGLIVGGMFLAFLALWGIALVRRNARIRREQEQQK